MSDRYFFGELLPRPPPEGLPVVLGALAGLPLPPPLFPPPLPRFPRIIGLVIALPPLAALTAVSMVIVLQPSTIHNWMQPFYQQKCGIVNSAVEQLRGG